MIEPTVPTLGSRSGPRLVLVLSIVAATSLLYWPTTVSLIRLWSTHRGTYQTTGYLMAALSLWALVRRRAELSNEPLHPRPMVALGVLLLGMGWLLTFGASIQLAHQALLPALVWTTIWAVCGWRIALICTFTCVSLYLAVPIWDLLTYPLQRATVLAVELLLRMVRIPAFVTGDFVQIPEGTFEIQGGCAGLGFFIVALTLAAHWGDLRRDSIRTRLLLLGLGAVFGVVGNWIRVFCIVVIGHLSDMQNYLVRVSHYDFGWGVFAIVMAAFFFLANFIPATSQTPLASAPADGMRRVASGRFLHTATIFACLAIPPIWSTAIVHRHSEPPPMRLLAPPSPPWKGPFSETDGWHPTFRGADAQELGRYYADGRAIEVYVAAYARQTQTKKLLGYFNSILGSDSLTVVDSRRISTAAGTFNELRLRESATGNEWLLLYTYQIGERVYASGWRAQVSYSLESLVRTPQSRAVALRIRCRGSCEADRENLLRFVSENVRLLAPPRADRTRAFTMAEAAQ